MATVFNQIIGDKELLLNRIKDLVFVDDVSEFECKRCGDVLIHHYISNCGHAFCANCRSLLGDGSGRWKCAQCQEHVIKINFQDFEFERKLFELRVRCANNKYGCSLTCSLKELVEHLKSCAFTLENALPVIFNGTNAKETVFEHNLIKLNENFDKLSADMELMKEKVENIQATTEIKLKHVNDRIDSMYSLLHVITTNVNNNSTEFDSSQTHPLKHAMSNYNKVDLWLKTNQEFNCEFKKLNEENIRVSSMVKDLENKMELVKPHLSRLESYIDLIKLQVQPLTFTNLYSNRTADFVWKITDAKNELKQEDFHNVQSEVFQLTNYQIEAQAELRFAFNEFSAVVSLMDSKDTENEVLKVQPDICMIIRNQVEDRDIVRSASKKFGCSENIDYHLDAIDKSMLDGLFASYIKNNTLILEFHVEPPSMTTHAYSHDGTLSWAIHNYKKRKQMELSEHVGFHHSPYFYTHQNGYRVRVLLSFSGLCVSARVDFVTGEFDDRLSTLFSRRTTLTIVNQKNACGHVIKSEVHDDVDVENWIRMGSHKEIENVIVNDTLYYHVKIEAL